jgi:hypothetical protein
MLYVIPSPGCLHSEIPGEFQPMSKWNGASDPGDLGVHRGHVRICFLKGQCNEIFSKFFSPIRLIVDNNMVMFVSLLRITAA